MIRGGGKNHADGGAKKNSNEGKGERFLSPGREICRELTEEVSRRTVAVGWGGDRQGRVER